MHILTVYAHPSSKSFNGAILETVEEVVSKKGHSHTVRDLYQMRFDPVLKDSDFTAFDHGRTPKDIKVEQDHVAKSDVLVFIHPIWWFGVPAILKGWIERVFTYGFAYAHDSRGVKAGLDGKKAVIINTTGGAEKTNYIDTGFKKAYLDLNDRGIHDFVGLDVILHRFFYQVPVASRDERHEMLDLLRLDLGKIL